MKKSYTFAKKAAVIAAQQISVLITLGLILYTIISCIIVDEQGYYFINPIEEKTYNESANFRTKFSNDSYNLVYYLALCQQFETDGEFNDNKRIDILNYYYRKQPSERTITSKGSLIYKVSDLINWQSTISYTDGGLVNEYIAVQEDLSMLKNNMLAELNYINRVSKANGIFKSILISVTEDLNINYNSYNYQKEVYANSNTNFKYLFIPKKPVDETVKFYTNMDIYTLEDAENSTEYFDSTLYEKGDLTAYLIIDVATKKVIERSTNISNVSQLEDALNGVSYVFPDGGKIYICVNSGDIGGFARYESADMYARGMSVYTNLQKNIYKLMTGAIVALLSALIFFILYTVMCGNKSWYEYEEVDGVAEKKLITTSARENLNIFDKIYSEVFSVIGLGICVGMGFMYIYIFMEVLESSFRTFLEEPLFLFASIAYMLIFNSIILAIYGSIVKRIKAGTFIKGLLIVKIAEILWRIICFLCRIIKNTAINIKNGIINIVKRLNVLAKLLITFVPFAILNIIFGASRHIVFLVLIFIADIGVFLYLFKKDSERLEILEGIGKISAGQTEYKIDIKNMHGDNLKTAEAVNSIGEGIKQAVETSMKDERLKADLITNVSHDIKTPLTSIINYVDLLKRENIQDEKSREYINVLEAKSQRLKQLTEDLVEASKISSGNITLIMERLNIIELLNQMTGEFSGRFEEKGLSLVTRFPENEIIITADGRRMWRVFENLYTNICKYAMPNTRVYLEVYEMRLGGQDNVYITIKNISEQPLNINADELTERFIRGDVSRSTEGSGLGLSIAKSLVQMQEGNFDIYLDGDLFKITISFKREDMLI